MEWKYCKLSNQLSAVYGKNSDGIRPEYVLVVGIDPTQAGHWAGVYEISAHWGVSLTSGKFCPSVRKAIEWAESFVKSSDNGGAA